MRRSLFVVFLCALASVAPDAARAQSGEIATAVANRQQELRNQLNAIESQIAEQQKLLDAAASERQTIQTQITVFNAEIKKTQLQIRAITLTIDELSGDIGERNRTLSSLSSQLAAEQESLAQILRRTQMLDAHSAISVALGSQNVSAFFSDLDAFVSIKRALADSFERIRNTSATTEAEKEQLEERLAEQEKLRAVAELAKRLVVAQEREKRELLEKTKGIEANFQKLIAVSQRTAAQIRTKLFQLAGDGAQISLPTAIALARQAGAATGVRPAFILGILRQETNLGANVGQCLLTNSPNKGDGKGKNTGTFFRSVMKPTRDVDPFTHITSALGLDPFSMPVSCPQAGGYGGAMGPAQFIPSTWKLYQNRIAKLAGHMSAPANPWNNLDAFIAVAIYMADLGAGAQTYTAERTAALKYFAGSNWRKLVWAPYGDSVMGFTSDFQKDINALFGGSQAASNNPAAVLSSRE